MFHTAGCVIATLGPLWIGGTVILVERFRPAPVLEALRREHVSVLFYVPTILGALLECQRGASTPAPRLRVIMGGASNVPSAMIEEAEEVFGGAVMNLFGQTELAPVLSATRPTDSRQDKLTTVGRPLPHVECKIVDPTSGETVAIGQPGEICARGYQQFVEYLHDPDATARAVDAEGFVHTGDLGTLDARGYLTVTGRLKELIIRGGENISPVEIETVLVGHDAVLDVAVVGVPDDRWGEIVAAVIRVHDDAAQLDKAELVDYLAARLAPFKVPARWFVTDSLPTTPTGKVQKFALRDAIACGRPEGALTWLADIDGRRQALREAFPKWTPTTLHGRLDSSARLYGSRPLVITDDVILTYRDVAFESQRLAAGLRKLGIERGDRVGLVMANHPEFATLKFAISRAGAIAVPFNFLYQQDELAYVLADSGCRVLVTMTGFDGLDYQAHARRLRARLGPARFRRPHERTQRHGARAATRGGPGHRRTRAARGPVGRRLGDTGRPASGRRLRRLGLDPSDPADMLYTSGTTGTPKGVIVLARRRATDRVRLCVDPRLRRWTADSVLAALLPHVRLRRGSAVGALRRRSHHPAHEVQPPSATSRASNATGRRTCCASRPWPSPWWRARRGRPTTCPRSPPCSVVPHPHPGGCGRALPRSSASTKSSPATE